MTDDLDAFRSFAGRFERRPEWQPFARNLLGLLDSGHPELGPISSKLIGWARRHLGADYEDTLAEGYVAFVTDVNRSQLKYEAAGAYRNKSYADVYASVYDNRAFMSTYHWGVYATTFAWPHHLEISRFYRERFLEVALASAEAERVVDLGCGSGLWSFLLLNAHPEYLIDAVDISETSSSIAGQMARAIGLDGRFTVDCADALTWSEGERDGAFEAGISCFLLEHLERPERLLENLARLIKPRGVAFVTAALTAAESDHIMEFRRESEIVALAEAAGFRVMETLCVGPPNYIAKARFLPRSMAMILSKRTGEVW